jgi:hypothetical protein
MLSRPLECALGRNAAMQTTARLSSASKSQ